MKIRVISFICSDGSKYKARVDDPNWSDVFNNVLLKKLKKVAERTNDAGLVMSIKMEEMEEDDYLKLRFKKKK
jgi:hypothetical protein